MSNPIADFGNVAFVPRLKLKLESLFTDFQKEGFDDDGEFVRRINGFCKFVMYPVYSGESDSDGVEEAKVADLSIVNLKYPFVLLETRIILEECRLKKTREKVINTFIRAFLKRFSEFEGNLRNVILCHCLYHSVKKMGEDCSYCHENACNHSETCTICLEEERKTAVWAETSCKHRFHHSCLTKWVDLNKSCPICRAECNYSKFHIL